MLINVGLIWLAIRRVRSPRYAAERRSSVRFATRLNARLDGIDGTVRDVSLTGARVELPVPAAVAEHARLTVEVRGGVPIEFTGSSRSTWTDDRGRTMVGFEFDDGQHAARAQLALALFAVDEKADQPAAVRPAASAWDTAELPAGSNAA